VVGGVDANPRLERAVSVSLEIGRGVPRVGGDDVRFAVAVEVSDRRVNWAAGSPLKAGETGSRPKGPVPVAHANVHVGPNRIIEIVPRHHEVQLPVVVQISQSNVARLVFVVNWRAVTERAVAVVQQDGQIVAAALHVVRYHKVEQTVAAQGADGNVLRVGADRVVDRGVKGTVAVPVKDTNRVAAGVHRYHIEVAIVIQVGDGNAVRSDAGRRQDRLGESKKRAV